MSVAELEDAVLRKILAVTLNPEHANSAANPPVLHLAGLAQVTDQTSLSGALAWPLISAVCSADQPELNPEHLHHTAS
jgi:hypothetical protein